MLVVVQVVIETMIATSADDTTVTKTARIDAIVIGLIDTAPGLLYRRKTMAIIARIEAGETNETTAMTETEGTEIAETEHDGMTGIVGTIRGGMIGTISNPGIGRTRDVGIHTNVVGRHRDPPDQRLMVVRETIATTPITVHLEIFSLAGIGPATDSQIASTPMVEATETPRNSKKTARDVWLRCSPTQQTWKKPGVNASPRSQLKRTSSASETRRPGLNVDGSWDSCIDSFRRIAWMKG